MASVVFTPKTYAKIYLKSLSYKLLKYSGLLFTDRAESVVAAFENKYGVNVKLQSPFPTCASLKCFSQQVSVNSVFTYSSFSFSFAESGTIYNISITNMNGSLSPYSKAGLGPPPDQFEFSLKAPSGFEGLLLSAFCLIGATDQFSFGLSDASTTAFNCNDKNS